MGTAVDCAMGYDGAPGEIRTPDLTLRRRSLYPAELRARLTRIPQFVDSPAEGPRVSFAGPSSCLAWNLSRVEGVAHPWMHWSVLPGFLRGDRIAIVEDLAHHRERRYHFPAAARISRI